VQPDFHCRVGPSAGRLVSAGEIPAGVYHAMEIHAAWALPKSGWAADTTFETAVEFPLVD